MDSIYKKLKIRVNALARVHGHYPGISMISKIIFAIDDSKNIMNSTKHYCETNGKREKK